MNAKKLQKLSRKAKDNATKRLIEELKDAAVESANEGRVEVTLYLSEQSRQLDIITINDNKYFDKIQKQFKKCMVIRSKPNQSGFKTIFNKNKDWNQILVSWRPMPKQKPETKEDS